MKVDLIPILDITYNNPNPAKPDKYPYWEYSVMWDKYHQESLSKAGFPDPLIPYLTGSSFYRLTDITTDNLIKLTKDHTKDLRAGKYDRKQASAFFGGYVLRIDGQDKFFPQCCGELSDIIYWEKLAKGNENAYCEGHPQPTVKIKNDLITFDFSVEENEEQFQPIPPSTILLVDRKALRQAVDQVKQELADFSESLRRINETELLNIIDIDKLLVWDNPNQE